MCCRRKLYSILVAGVVLLAAGSALGQENEWPSIPDCDVSITSSDVSCYIVPDGTGTPLTECFYFGGEVADATITVTLNSAPGVPLSNFNFKNIRLLQTGYLPLIWCADSYYTAWDYAPNCADTNTNADGKATFSMAYHGGGWWVNGVEVWVMSGPGIWSVLPRTLPLYFNSPDMDGSLTVDLFDITEFCSAYFGTYEYRADFYWDGVLNLSDVVILAQARSRHCP